MCRRVKGYVSGNLILSLFYLATYMYIIYYFFIIIISHHVSELFPDCIKLE